MYCKQWMNIRGLNYIYKKKLARIDSEGELREGIELQEKKWAC